MKTYYYHFNKFDKTFVAMVLGLVILAWMGFQCPCSWAIFILLILIWGYKNLMKQKAVVITDKSIKIDHCEPIAWDDIESAEEKIVRCGFKNRKVIILKPKKGIKYKAC